MRIFSILLLTFLSCAVCTAQDKNAALEADPPTFQQTLDKFPTLYNSEDWKLINQKAETFFKGEEYSEADNFSLKGRILAEKLQDNLLIARSFHQLGRVQTKLLDYAKAKEYFGQAALFYTRTEKTPPNKLEVGFLLKDLAFIYSNPEFINKSQDLNTALFYLFQAYKVATSFPDLQRSEDLLIQTSLQIATCFGIRGDFPAQIVWLEKVLTLISKDNTDSPYLFDVYFGLQSAYRAVGSYEEAFRNLKKAESWLKRNPDQHKRLKFLRHLSDFYTQINYSRERDKALSEGILLSKKLNSPEMLGDFYSAKLLKLLEDRKLKEAAEYLSLLEVLSGKNSYLVNKLDVEVARAVLAGYGNDRVKSQEYFRLAEKTLEEASGGEWTNTLFLLIWESRVALYQKDYEKLKLISEKYLDAASKAGSLDSLPQIHINLAKSYAGTRDFLTARKYNKNAIDLIESKRLSNSAQISTGVMEGLYEAYEQLISYNLAENKPDEAFLGSELLKARFLADKISNNPLNKKITIDEKLKAEIFNVSVDLLQKPDNFETAAKLSGLERDAVFYEGKTGETSISKVNKNLLADLNNSLVDQDAAVISYAFTEGGKLVAFTWQKGKPINAVPLDLTLEEVDKIALETSQKIKDFIFFKQDGKSVFDKLIKPLHLAPDIKHLIIIPDKTLWKIPFQALSEDGRTYLIENKLVSYAPSVSVLLNQLNNPEPERRSFQVFANSLYKNFYLKFADAEARELAAGFNVKPILNAVISNFSANSDKSDIVHFSMHAEVERYAPFNSFLAFKPTPQTDGRLTVDELLKMRLKKGSLVFLASCDTTNVFNGEGMVSLAWGMFGAGASTVISAQWEANDQSTSIFTRSFYKNLKQGLSSAEALQQASVKMIRNKNGNLSEPYFWAEFTLNGDYR